MNLNIRQLMTKLSDFWSVICIVISTCAIIIALMTGVAPLGVPGEWEWILERLHSGYKLLYPFCPILLLGFLSFTALKRIANGYVIVHRFFLIAATIFTFFVPVCIMYMHPGGPLQVTSLILNPASNSYYQTAVEHQDILNLLADYHKQMPKLISHARTQAPGPVVLHWLLHEIFARSSFAMDVANVVIFISSEVNCLAASQLFRNFWGDWIQSKDVAAAFWITLTLCALGSFAIIPLYYFVRRMLGIEAAIGAVIFFSVIPSFSSFAPSVDQIYPVVTLSVLCLAEAVVDAFSIRRMAMAGIWSASIGLALGLGVFCNMGLIVVMLLVTLYVGFRNMATTDGFHEKCLNFSIFFASMLSAFIAIFLLLWILFRFNLLTTFLVSDAFRQELYAGPPGRTYWKWLLWNPIDFFLFAGLPLTWLFVEGAVRDFIKLRQIRKIDSLHCFTGAFLVTLVMLDLSGKVRGESGRMWMFLMPCLIPHAMWCLQSYKWCEFRHRLFVVFLLQAIITVVLREYVLVWGY